MKFEEKMERLQVIAQSLDRGDVPLEDLLKLYEEGMGLVKECREFLESATQKVETIQDKFG